jgi:hypothetical protein
MEKTKGIKILLLIVFVVVIVLIYAIIKLNTFPSLKQASNESTAINEKQDSQKLFDLEEKMDNEDLKRKEEIDTVSQIRSIIRNTKSPAVEAQGKVLLSRMLIYKIAKSPSALEGVTLLKEVVKNKSYPAAWRAMAYESMASSIRDVGDEDYLSVYWKDDELKKLKNEAYPEDGTIKNICEASFKIMPFPICSYRIANFELSRLIEDKVYHTLSDQEREAFLEDAKEKIAAAQDSTENYPLSHLNLFEHGKTVFFHAVTQNQLYLLGLIPEDYKFQAEGEFQEAINIFNNGKLFRIPESFFTFYYAVFLSEMYGDSKIDQIRSLTDHLVDTYNKYHSTPFIRFLKVQTLPVYDKTFLSMRIARISRMNPNFKRFMGEIGWSQNRLNMEAPKLP